MEQRKVGLSDISIYVPSPRMELDRLVGYRSQGTPELERRLSRAVAKTGQKAFHFPAPWEDSATLAAQSARSLLVRNRERIESLRYIGSGTETTVDLSKPVAAYVEGMLQSSGVPVPETLLTFQSQHACAGGTVAMLAIAGMLTTSSSRDSGLVISTDVARYDVPSSAEITQGSGAVSLLLEQDPALIELDLATVGFCSRDVDDFFRPIGSVTARVKGAYSIQCYDETLDCAFHDHCVRLEMTPETVLHATDMYAFHVPFKMMALTAFQRLVSHHTGLHGDALAEFVTARGFEESLEPNTESGNLYTASTFLTLAELLRERYQTLGDGIIGKRLMIASYGSGNTMIVIAGRVAPRAPEIIESWNLGGLFSGSHNASFEEYEKWLQAPYPATEPGSRYSVDEVPAGSYYLKNIREDGYREYAFKE